MCVLCRNPNRWTVLDEIWHRGGSQGQEGSWEVNLYPTPRYGVRKGGLGYLWSLRGVFWQKPYKTKVAGRL